MNKSVQGFSLIEVMVTMSIMMVIALGMAALMNQQARDQRTVKAKSTFLSIVSTVQMAASNPQAIRDSSVGMVSQNVLTASQTVQGGGGTVSSGLNSNQASASASGI
jgi:Tfp pilus assembly protein PilV